MLACVCAALLPLVATVLIDRVAVSVGPEWSREVVQDAQAPSARDLSLLRLVPADALITVHIPNVRGLSSRRETSRWVECAFDPAWIGILANLRDHHPDEAESLVREADAAMAAIVAALAGAGEAVLFARGDPLIGTSTVLGFAVRGGDDVGLALRQLMRDVTPAQEGGLEIWAGESGAAEAYFRRGDLHLLIDARDAPTAVAFGREALARCDSDAPLRPRLAAFEAAAYDLEFEVDLRVPWAISALRLRNAAGSSAPAFEPFLKALETIGWLHGRARLGDGERLDVVLDAPYTELGLAQRLSSTLGAADPTLLGLAPAGCAAAAFGFEPARLVEVVLGELAASAPRQHELLQAALGIATEALGIDVVGALVGNLTGTALCLAASPDSIDLPARVTTAGNVSARGGLGASCLALGLRDAEPFLGAAETLGELAGTRTDIASSSLRGADIWTLQLDGAPLTFAVHAEHLCIATDARVLEAFLARTTGQPDPVPGLLSDPGYAEQARELAGPWISLSSTSTVVALAGRAIFDSAQNAVGSSTSATARFAPIAARAGALLTRLGREHFTGHIFSELALSGGHIVLRIGAR